MTTVRTYGDGCGIAHALDLVGERWALLVVRELLLGPLRFSDLRAGLPGAGPNVLSQRLRELEAAGVIRRRTLPPPAAAKVYELTRHGAELGPILTALGSWALRSPSAPAGHLSAVSAVLTLQTRYRPSDWTAAVRLNLGDRSYCARISPDGIAVTADPEAGTDATVTTDPATFVELVTGGREPAGADVGIDGDARVVRRLLAACR